MSSKPTREPSFSNAKEADKKQAGARKSFESVSTLPQYEEGDFVSSSEGAAKGPPSQPYSGFSKSKSKLGAAYQDIKSKIRTSNKDDEDPALAAERLVEKQQREEERKREYERLGLEEKAKFGWGRAGMNFNG
ncbi:uncharacterized protein K452DRAFT_355220 [Aplosporella prunicola CBS 121167]|uniref:Uncharacterized protein n=1 Tax=Aplosporella prunicola CBS 121167 TaxID=1176127 RepID=A0A6A6BRZ6_9PEZI|nr:uncharacterized protein K452DRAFT_355220 [Aplosporella prunicola CBS 121167]KAF2146770.1 hypothetical protein K452DRAFT_355220 [Aplosporella prunicola CBS 121167]